MPCMTDLGDLSSKNTHSRENRQTFGRTHDIV